MTGTLSHRANLLQHHKMMQGRGLQNAFAQAGISGDIHSKAMMARQGFFNINVIHSRLTGLDLVDSGTARGHRTLEGSDKK